MSRKFGQSSDYVAYRDSPLPRKCPPGALGVDASKISANSCQNVRIFRGRPFPEPLSCMTSLPHQQRSARLGRLSLSPSPSPGQSNPSFPAKSARLGSLSLSLSLSPGHSDPPFSAKKCPVGKSERTCPESSGKVLNYEAYRDSPLPRKCPAGTLGLDASKIQANIVQLALWGCWMLPRSQPTVAKMSEYTGEDHSPEPLSAKICPVGKSESESRAI
jgi:hypothetical protein